MTISMIRAQALLAAAMLLAAFDSPAAEAPAPADGLYLPAGSSPAQCRSEDEGLLPGARRDAEVLKKRLKATSNANTSFRLLIAIPKVELQQDPCVVVAGSVYPLTGAGSPDPQTSQLIFAIPGDEKAKAVAQHFGIPVEYSRHPGHRLRVFFTPGKDSFTRGEEVTATLRIVNLGTEPVVFTKGGRARGPRDNQYIFSAYRSGQSVPDRGSNQNQGGDIGAVVVQPSATYEDKVSLSKWFEFKDAGRYEIHGSYLLRLLESADGLQDINWAMEAIWTDYVGADFSVEIR
jgi:hypothetical protein